MTPEGQRRGSDRLGAWCWLGCLQFFVAEALTTVGWQGHYSYRTNFISDLGAQGCRVGCSDWHAVMNASLFLQGVLIAAGTLLLGRRALPHASGRLARGLLLLAGIGVCVVAISPEDVNANLHILGARVYFLSSSVAMVCAALAMPYGRVGSRGAPVSFVAAGVALLGDWLLAFGNSQSATVLGAGTIERVAAYPFTLWLAWTGFTLLRRRAGER